MTIAYLYLWSIYHHYDLRQIWLICCYKIHVIEISKEELNYPEYINIDAIDHELNWMPKNVNALSYPNNSFTK